MEFQILCSKVLHCTMTGCKRELNSFYGIIPKEIHLYILFIYFPIYFQISIHVFPSFNTSSTIFLIPLFLLGFFFFPCGLVLYCFFKSHKSLFQFIKYLPSLDYAATLITILFYILHFSNMWFIGQLPLSLHSHSVLKCLKPVSASSQSTKNLKDNHSIFTILISWDYLFVHPTYI